MRFRVIEKRDVAGLLSLKEKKSRLKKVNLKKVIGYQQPYYQPYVYQEFYFFQHETFTGILINRRKK